MPAEEEAAMPERQNRGPSQRTQSHIAPKRYDETTLGKLRWLAVFFLRNTSLWYRTLMEEERKGKTKCYDESFVYICTTITCYAAISQGG